MSLETPPVPLTQEPGNAAVQLLKEAVFAKEPQVQGTHGANPPVPAEPGEHGTQATPVPFCSVPGKHGWKLTVHWGDPLVKVPPFWPTTTSRFTPLIVGNVHVSRLFGVVVS
jgi:hypothetical protein